MKYLIYIFLLSLSVPAYSQINLSTDLPLTPGQNGDTTIILTQAFHIGGENFVPQGSVTLKWIQDSMSFYLNGQTFTMINGHPFQIHFGTTADARVKIRSDRVFNFFDPFVVDTFEIEGQKFVGTYDSTHYNINPDNLNKEIYGKVRIVIDGDTFRANMGDEGHPGFIFDDTAPDVWVQVNENIAIKGLTPAKKPNIILKHLPTDPPNTYYGHGDMLIVVYADILAASLGSSKKPGLVIRNGVIDTAEMTVAGGGLLFGLLPILNYFDMEFNHHHMQWAINGTIIIGVPLGGVAKLFGAKYVPSLTIDAGSGTTAGFLYNTSTHEFTVNDAIFELNNINGSKSVELGGFALNSLALGVKNNVPDSIKGIVTLPPGFGVDASLAWELTPNDPHYPFVITSIEAQFSFKDINLAPALGTSGFFLASMGGGITNLDKPKDMTFFGDIGLMYGKPLKLDLSWFPGISGPPKDVALAYMEDKVSLNSHGLTLEADGYLGGLFSGGRWQPILGNLKLSAEIFWGNKYRFNTGLTMFGIPALQYLDAEFILDVNNKGDLDGLGSVDLFVPPSIPIVGGKHLAHAQGAIRHHHDMVPQSYGAGWFTVNLLFDKLHLGFKSSFSGDIRKIGAADERAIVKQVTTEEQDGTTDHVWCTINHHFTVDQIKPAAYFQNQLIVKDHSKFIVGGANKRQITIRTNSPDGVNRLKEDMPSDANNTFKNKGAAEQYSAYQIRTDLNISDTLNFVAYNSNADSYTSINWVDQPDLLLAPGEYVLTVTGVCNDGVIPDESDFELRASPVYPRPTIDISLQPGTQHDVTIHYSSYLTDSTTISLYWNTIDSSNGKKLHLFDYFEGTPIGDSIRQLVQHFDPGVLTQDTIYLYAVIDDHVNPPVYSEIKFDYYSPSLTVFASIDSVQIILEPADTTLEYVSTFLNDKPDPVFGTIPHVIFYNLPLGTYTVEAFLHDSTHYFDQLYVERYGDAVATYETKYNSPEWINSVLTVTDWGDLTLSYAVKPGKVLLHGKFLDPEGNVITNLDINVLLMDPSSDMITSKSKLTQGHYIFLESDLTTAGHQSGYFDVAVFLPPNNEYYWHDVRTERLISNQFVYGITHYETNILIPDYSIQLDFIIEKGNPGDPEGVFFHATDYSTNDDIEGAVVTLKHPNPAIPNV